MANFKGGFAFNNEAAKVEVEQAPDGTLISCVNPVTGESLGGGGDLGLIVEPAAGSTFLQHIRNLSINSVSAQLIFLATAGDVIVFTTTGKYKTSSIITKEGGVAVTYTTTGETSTGATYTFTMPDEGVLIALYYDD